MVKYIQNIVVAAVVGALDRLGARDILVYEPRIWDSAESADFALKIVSSAARAAAWAMGIGDVVTVASAPYVSADGGAEPRVLVSAAGMGAELIEYAKRRAESLGWAVKST